MTGLMIFTKVVKVPESLLKPINNASSESFFNSSFYDDDSES